ncbi:MAG TPA: hypothetical protein VGK32_22165 [Vicinamibacterales bacterium]|jgi:hypothetical protein
MTALHAIVVQLDDLQTLTLVCTCGAKITIKFDATLVERCPSCKTQFDKAAQDAQVVFQNLHTTLRASSAHVEFSIPVPDSSAPSKLRP